MVSETERVLNVFERAVEQTIARLSVNITAELIETTPVDTGWARANWVPSIGTAFEGNTGELNEEQRRASVGGQTGSQQTATAALLAYQVERGQVFISNNVPYILALNDGSSAQAPSGFVQASIQRGIASLNNVVIG